VTYDNVSGPIQSASVSLSKSSISEASQSWQMCEGFQSDTTLTTDLLLVDAGLLNLIESDTDIIRFHQTHLQIAPN